MSAAAAAAAARAQTLAAVVAGAAAVPAVALGAPPAAANFLHCSTPKLCSLSALRLFGQPLFENNKGTSFPAVVSKEAAA